MTVSTLLGMRYRMKSPRGRTRTSVAKTIPMLHLHARWNKKKCSGNGRMMCLSHIQNDLLYNKVRSLAVRKAKLCRHPVDGDDCVPKDIQTVETDACSCVHLCFVHIFVDRMAISCGMSCLHHSFSFPFIVGWVASQSWKYTRGISATQRRHVKKQNEKQQNQTHTFVMFCRDTGGWRSQFGSTCRDKTNGQNWFLQPHTHTLCADIVANLLLCGGGIVSSSVSTSVSSSGSSSVDCKGKTN